MTSSLAIDSSFLEKKKMILDKILEIKLRNKEFLFSTIGAVFWGRGRRIDVFVVF